MYKSFFGFKEKPFKLLPDPTYLYMSKNHDTVFAQLTYAIEQGDGFVLITGEVGTGKTTLCRMFLERMAGQAETAYIFNTQIDTAHLLESICTEFGATVANPTNLKTLLEICNDHLISIHQQHKKAILVIDEAQNLSISNLEMVRMLSNLETTRNKLVQIVLVGQPELVRKLESYELRQLSQRIALTIELTPLSAADTAVFIKHRIAIAAQRQLDLFTTGAFRTIFHYSGGIPRLINIAADRALMTAYELKKPKVTRAVAGFALRTVNLPSRSFTRRGLGKKALWLTSCCIFLIAFGSGLLLSRKSQIKDGNPVTAEKILLSSDFPDDIKKDTIELPEMNQTEPVMAVVSVNSPNAMPSDEKPIEKAPGTQLTDLQSFIAGMDPVASRLNALVYLLALWQQPSPHPNQFPAMVDDATYYQIAALQYGLQLLVVKKDRDLVRRLNLPAIVTFAQSPSQPFVYLTLVGAREQNWLMTDGVTDHIIEVDSTGLDQVIAGPVYIFWNNLLATDAIISHGAPVEAINGLKRLLRLSGFNLISNGPNFDPFTQQAVVEFQKRNNVQADGLVGPITKILLIHQDDRAQLPKLNQTAVMPP
jgi:general secretion pathway protein A